MSYVYSAMAAFFDRDTVGLPGLAKYFRADSDEERGHAGTLMRLQNERGGRVELQAMLHPEARGSVHPAGPGWTPGRRGRFACLVLLRSGCACDGTAAASSRAETRGK